MQKRKAFKYFEYCSHCKRVTPHLKDEDEIMCLRCGRKFKRINMKGFADADLRKDTKTAGAWVRGLAGR